MTVVTLDSSNLEAVLADAGYEAPELTVKPEPADKPAEPAIKAEDKPAEPKPGEQADPDDVEGEDGLTPRQKREMSASMLKAIGRKHRQKMEAEEFAGAQYREKMEAESRATELARELAELKGKAEPAQTQTEPARENYATDAEYMKATVAWNVKEAIAADRAQRAQEEAKGRMSAQITRARGLVPDFADVVGKANLEVPPNVKTHMEDSDLFAELGYHFAKNPDALKRLASLPPVRQLVELGKIEATLTPFAASTAAKVAPADGKPTKAAPSSTDTGFTPSKPRSDAPVIRPLTSGEGQQVEPDVHGMNVREMIQDFQKTHKVNLASRKRH